MKNLIGSLALAALALVLVGRPAPAAADDKEYEMKITTLAPDKTAWAKVLKEYKTNVEKAAKDKGYKIKVRVFLGGTLTDDENNSVKMTKRGQVQAVGASTGAVASLVEALEAIEIPFQFKTAQEADYVLDKHLKDAVKPMFEANGLVFGFWSENGFRHFAGSFGPIKAPADLKGQKVRSQESFPHLKMWEALGASAQAIPTGEVQTALKTGSVKGYDQSLLYSIAGSWHSHITDLTLSAHIYQGAVIMFNKDWFYGLPAELQAILLDEGDKLVRKGRKAIRDMNPKLLKIIQDTKVKGSDKKVAVHKLSDAEREAFAQATKGVRDQVAGRSADHKKLVELIEKGLKEFRAKKGKK